MDCAAGPKLDETRQLLLTESYARPVPLTAFRQEYRGPRANCHPRDDSIIVTFCVRSSIMPVSCELAPDAIATTKTPGHRLSVGILGRLTGRWTFYRIDGAIWKIALEIPTIPRSNGKKVGPFRREGKSRESGNDMGQAAAVERIAPAIVCGQHCPSCHPAATRRPGSP